MSTGLGVQSVDAAQAPLITGELLSASEDGFGFLASVRVLPGQDV